MRDRRIPDLVDDNIFYADVPDLLGSLLRLHLERQEKEKT